MRILLQRERARNSGLNGKGREEKDHICDTKLLYCRTTHTAQHTASKQGRRQTPGVKPIEILYHYDVTNSQYRVLYLFQEFGLSALRKLEKFSGRA
jgi:hypothetical protein